MRNSGIRRISCASLDPAENPNLMDRLWFLVRALRNEVWEDDPPVIEDPNIESADRQTFVCKNGERRVTIGGPVEMIAALRYGIEDIRSHCRTRLRIWVSLLPILHRAYDALMRTDPEAIPTRASVLKRDHYHCQVPGCTRRAHLHAHHVHWRSRGGRDTLSNMICVCAFHHAMIHDGHIEVSGEAPHALTWKLGCRLGKEPLAVYRGQRLIAGGWRLETETETQLARAGRRAEA